MKNLVLIGFMGTGKSTLGRFLASRLRREFIDTDNEIEKIAGKTVAQLIASQGLARFRSEEVLLVKKLAGRENLVIATGGGTLLDPENRRLLEENGIIIGLEASLEVIYNRVKRKKNQRPLLAEGDLKEQIAKLAAERRDLYRVAAYTVDTGQVSLEEAVEKILSFLSGGTVCAGEDGKNDGTA